MAVAEAPNRPHSTPNAHQQILGHLLLDRFGTQNSNFSRGTQMYVLRLGIAAFSECSCHRAARSLTNTDLQFNGVAASEPSFGRDVADFSPNRLGRKKIQTGWKISDSKPQKVHLRAPSRIGIPYSKTVP